MSMDIFRAAKCLACSRLVSGGGILSAVRQASTLLKPTPSTAVLNSATTRPFVSSATLPRVPAQPSISVSGGVACRVSASRSVLTGGTPGGSSLLPVSSALVVPARGRVQINYQPSAWKRVNKHSMEKRLRSPGGIEVLWRRVLKKRHCLTPFDRILPGTYNGQILPKHHLKYNQHLVSRQVRKRVKEAVGRK
ncbi:hypothetical protein ACOMHN_026915 [Nucella lapillus]